MMRFNHLPIVAAIAAAGILVSSFPVMAADSDRREKRQRQMKRSADMSEPERLNKLLGSQVISSDRERIGTLSNLALDLESGHVLFAVVNTDDGRIALPPGVFNHTREDRVRLSINREKAMQAPKVTSDTMEREQMAQASFVHRVHEQFNQPAWWQGSGSASEGKFNNVHAGKDLTGMKVVNVMDRNIGEVRNAVVDLPEGRIVYVALEPSKDLNLSGNKLYALPPSALTLHKDGKKLVSDVTREKLDSAPSFSRDQWPSMTDRSFASRVYQHYGKQAYFESRDTGLAPTGRDDDRYYEDDEDYNERDED